MDIQELRKTFTNVIAPEDAGYAESKAVFYGGIESKPLVIIQPVNADEVAKVVNLAKESGLELAIRSGGHSFAGFSTTQGGILLDLRKMKKLDIDETNETAWVEAGMTAGEYSAEIAKKDFVTGFGDTGSVGVGGITLGGGVGYLTRKFGLAIDNLLAAEIVTADGKLLKADEQNNPDLFWAIRGGGGNFGVVTRFQFKLHKLPHAYGGMMILPATPDTIAGFINAAKDAPNELSTIANIMPAPPMPFLPKEHHGKLIIMALMMYAGDETNGKNALTPFRSLTTPLADMVKPMKYFEIFPPEDPNAPKPTAVATTMFIRDVDLKLAEQIIRRLQESDAAMRVVQLRVLGGAAAQVPADATAYAHRSSEIMTNVAAFYNGEADKPVKAAWMKEFAQALNQGDEGAYVGFLSADEKDRITAAYPEATLKKLVEVKKKYDPTNLFKRNLNILPE